MSNPWFRLYAEFATDPIVQSLAFEDQRHFVVIMCLKCNGVLDRNLTPENRERIINRSLGLDNIASLETKRRLSDVGLIDQNWQPIAWDKRQFISDHSTERSRKSRNNKESENDIATTDRTEAATSLSVSVSVSDSESMFNIFYESHPKKKARKVALKSWLKIDPALYQTIIEDVKNRTINDDDWVRGYAPHPSTYLNQERWNDEITTKGAVNGNNTSISTTAKPTQRQKAIDAFRNHIK